LAQEKRSACVQECTPQNHGTYMGVCYGSRVAVGKYKVNAI
jgi:hypothetical protein